MIYTSCDHWMSWERRKSCKIFIFLVGLEEIPLSLNTSPLPVSWYSEKEIYTIVALESFYYAPYLRWIQYLHYLAVGFPLLVVSRSITNFLKSKLVFSPFGIFTLTDSQKDSHDIINHCNMFQLCNIIILGCIQYTLRPW